MFRKIVPVMVLSLAMGCAGQNGKKQPTASEQGIKNWNGARAGALYNLANEQFQSGNLEDARKSLANAAKLAPDHILIRILSAKLFIEQGQLEIAEAELKSARELDAKLQAADKESGNKDPGRSARPSHPEVDYLTGVIYQRWNKLEEARAAYARARERDPNELAYLMADAEMLVMMDRRPEALAMLREKLSFFENSAALRDAVGQLLVQEYRDRSQNSEDRIQNPSLQEAVGLLRQASVLAPDEQPIREHYGMALFYGKQYGEAAIVLERLVKAPPAPPEKSSTTDDKIQKPSYATRADLWTALGECRLALNQPREARDAFETASQLQPAQVSTWLNLAKAALSLEDRKRAEISLKKAITMDPRSADANLLMGYLRLQESEAKAQPPMTPEVKTQKLEDALAAFRRATSFYNKDSAPADYALSLCMSGLVLEKMGRSDEAIGFYSQALKLKPNDELATSLLAKAQVSP